MASGMNGDDFTIDNVNGKHILPTDLEGNSLISEKEFIVSTTMHPENSQGASVSPDCSDSNGKNNNSNNNIIVENQVISSSNTCSSDLKSNLIITMPSPAGSQIASGTDTIQVEISNGSPSVDIDSSNVGFCLVCGDLGSGYHYSAFSCEGCKGFFKRTVQKNLTYRCKEASNCTINKFTRNSCQHCRFQQCLQVGMKREAVREDRTPGGKHRHKRRRVEEFNISSDGTIPCGPGAQTTDSLLDGLVSAAPDRIPKAEEIFSSTVILNNLTGNELLRCSYFELKYIIDWAKKVPGFQELCVVDQTSLLKSSFMELSVLRLSYRSMSLENVINFAEGLLVPVNYATNIAWGNELINASLEFSLRLRSIQLDHSEFCILNALVLTYPDASGVQDKQKVASMQTRILDSLRRYVAQKFPNDLQRYGKMLLRLPALRTLSAKAAERFMSLTLDGSFQLNELVSQMIS
nr:mollusc nuclear receptor [Doryteuthis pealeii]